MRVSVPDDPTPEGRRTQELSGQAGEIECGEIMNTPNTDWEQRIRFLLSQGKKIEAVKLYKEHTGVGLAAAKEAVEAMETGAAELFTAEPEDDLEAELLRLLRQERKLEAVKLCRDRRGVSLMEAKETVESLAARNEIETQGGGCLGVVVALAFIAIALGMTIC
jgi:ribosomal protein L7/L12